MPTQRKKRVNGSAGDSQKNEKPDDDASLKHPVWMSEDTRQLFRHYNWGTGKCDLTDEQADERERRQKISDQAIDGLLARRRQERLERWRNTPLNPETKAALNGIPPEAAWLYLVLDVVRAIEENSKEVQELVDKHQPDYDLDSLLLALQNLNPSIGLENFEYVSQGKVKLSQLEKADPLAVLDLVLEMVTTSDKWLTEVAT